MIDTKVTIAQVNGHYEVMVWSGDYVLQEIEHWYYSIGSAQEAARELEAIYTGLNQQLVAWAAKQAV